MVGKTYWANDIDVFAYLGCLLTLFEDEFGILSICHVEWESDL
jgi:hypothetical protein